MFSSMTVRRESGVRLLSVLIEFRCGMTGMTFVPSIVVSVLIADVCRFERLCSSAPTWTVSTVWMILVGSGLLM